MLGISVALLMIISYMRGRIDVKQQYNLYDRKKENE